MQVTSLQVMVVPSGFQRRVRKLEKKRWMRGTCYFARVDKKWLRRYGFTWVETMKSGQVIVSKDYGVVMCRAEDYRRVSDALDAGQIPTSTGD